MVRSVIGRVCAALTAAAVAALCAATPCLAVEVLDPVEETSQPVEETTQPQTIQYVTEETLPTLQEIDESIDKLTSEQVGSNTSFREKLQSIDEKLQKMLDNEKEGKKQKSETEYLSSIDDKLSLIADNTKQPEEIEQVGAKATRLAFVAYANVSPTGTYANYAAGYLPKLDFDEHYVFVQDTTSSHVLIMGDITQPDVNTFQGTDVKWVRWYYQNNTNGYVVEQGQSDVTVTCNDHTVLSDLPRYPDLPQYSQELLRKEVGFYALVLVCCSVFRDVWSWLVRVRSVSVADGGAS